MTLTCNACDGPVQVYDDNGAEIPRRESSFFGVRTAATNSETSS